MNKEKIKEFRNELEENMCLLFEGKVTWSDTLKKADDLYQKYIVTE